MEIEGSFTYAQYCRLMRFMALQSAPIELDTFKDYLLACTNNDKFFIIVYFLFSEKEGSHLYLNNKAFSF